jgi:CBS domain containing-hemolysin-like protein
LVVAQPLLLFARVAQPALWLMNGAGNRVVRMLGMRPVGSERMVHSVIELGLLIDETREAGVLSAEQAQFVQNVFQFTSRKVAEVMVPLDRMASLELHMPPEKVLDAVREGAHTRMPVYDAEPNNIVGIVNTKDLFHLFSLHGLVVLEDAMYPAPFVRPEDSVATVLRRLKRLKRHMAVVRDDAGKVHGLITLEDVLEEIVGEIEDEHDQMG